MGEQQNERHIMKKSAIILALALGVSAWSLTAQDQEGPPPAGERPPPGAGARGGPGRGPVGGFHLLPPVAMEQLNLTDDQKQQVAALEAEVKAKMEKILTPEQLEQLKQMRPPGRPGGPGGPGGQGGQGRPQRPPPEQ